MLTWIKWIKNKWLLVSREDNPKIYDFIDLEKITQFWMKLSNIIPSNISFSLQWLFTCIYKNMSFLDHLWN